MERSFTKIKDVDIKILNELNDKDLISVCQSNQYANSLCNEDDLWRNRVLIHYGKYLGTAPEIKRKYVQNRSWKQYYVWVSNTVHGKDVQNTFKNAVKEGRSDIVKILLDDPRVDPSVDNNWYLRLATDEEVINLLLEDPRVAELW